MSEKKVNIEHLAELFETQIFDKADEVDPSSSEDWSSLALGWALGKGLTPEDAHEFVTYVDV